MQLLLFPTHISATLSHHCCTFWFCGLDCFRFLKMEGSNNVCSSMSVYFTWHNIVYFKLIFSMVWEKGSFSFFCLWISNFTTTVCWRDHFFPIVCIWQPCWRSGDHTGWIYFQLSLFCSIDMYICFYGSTRLFWLLWFHSIFSNKEVYLLVLLSQSAFSYLGSFVVPN